MLIRISLVGDLDTQREFLNNSKFNFENLDWELQNCMDIKLNLIEQIEFSSDFEILYNEYNENLRETPRLESVIQDYFIEKIQEKNIGAAMSAKYYNFITSDGQLFSDYLKPKYYEGTLINKLKYVLGAAAWNSVANLGEQSLSVVLFLNEHGLDYPPEFSEYISYFYNENKNSNNLIIYKDWMYMSYSHKMCEVFQEANVADFYALNSRIDTSMKIHNPSLINEFLKNRFDKVEIIK